MLKDFIHVDDVFWSSPLPIPFPPSPPLLFSSNLMCPPLSSLSFPHLHHYFSLPTKCALLSPHTESSYYCCQYAQGCGTIDWTMYHWKNKLALHFPQSHQLRIASQLGVGLCEPSTIHAGILPDFISCGSCATVSSCVRQPWCVRQILFCCRCSLLLVLTIFQAVPESQRGWVWYGWIIVAGLPEMGRTHLNCEWDCSQILDCTAGEEPLTKH